MSDTITGGGHREQPDEMQTAAPRAPQPVDLTTPGEGPWTVSESHRGGRVTGQSFYEVREHGGGRWAYGGYDRSPAIAVCAALNWCARVSVPSGNQEKP